MKRYFTNYLHGNFSCHYFVSTNRNNTMKITITLTAAEVAGIKAYLCEVDGLEKPTKQDVAQFINSYTDIINSPSEAVSDYIRAAQQHIHN